MSANEPGSDDLELAELRGRLRGRWKAERRGQEREALHEHWTRRSLIDAVREAMDRGDQVAIHLPGQRTLTGHIIGVGRDYAVLRSTQPTREYSVQLGPPPDATADPPAGPMLYVEILPGKRMRPPRAHEVSAPTFQAVMQQYDFQQQQDPALTTEIGITFYPHRLAGTLYAHAGDHLYVRHHQGHDLLVPVCLLLYISHAEATDCDRVEPK